MLQNPGQQQKEARPNGNLTQTKRQFQFKLVMLGDAAVGKSSLMLRFVHDRFDEFYDFSIGAGFFKQSLSFDGKTIHFDIWVTAGQERFNTMAPLCYHGTHAAIVVYDITKPETYKRAMAWVNELHRQANPDIVIALVGNKADLADFRMVDYQEAQMYAVNTGMLFMETSAKTGLNINELFMAIAKKMPEPDSQDPTNSACTRGVNLWASPVAQPARDCCMI